MFSSVHDLIRFHALEFKEPQDAWIAHIHDGIVEYNHDSKLVHESFASHLNLFGNVDFDYRHSKPIVARYLDHVLTSGNEKLIEYVLSNFEMKKSVFVQRCQHGELLLKWALESGSTLSCPIDLCLSGENLSDKTAALLTDFAKKEGITGVQFPFTPEQIRENIEKLLGEDSDLDLRQGALVRIAKAFAEVYFADVPACVIYLFKENGRAVTKYLIDHPDLMSMDEFTDFVCWLEHIRRAGKRGAMEAADEMTVDEPPQNDTVQSNNNSSSVQQPEAADATENDQLLAMSLLDQDFMEFDEMSWIDNINNI
jgi:hypothetical protein